MDQIIEQSGHDPRVKEAPPPVGLPVYPTCAGIVAEYNPFHSGHAWMVRRLREGGVHTVVCVMSGPFVQRAEPALLPTHVRVRAALAGGVDLVLRLPVPWAVASAEGFARGAVGLLGALGCVDLLAFGAETPDAERLEDVARVLLSPEFPLVLKRELARGVSFAAARAAAAEWLLPGAAGILSQPNNILGVEYAKALQCEVPEALRAKMDEEVRWRVVSGLYGRTHERERLFMLPVPLALPRVGAGHDGMPAGGYASASWLRDEYQAGGLGAWAPFVPPPALKLYAAADAEGATLDSARFEVALMSRLRGMSAADIGRFSGAGEGLENRLADAARSCTTPEEMFAAAKTKRFAHSRVRRLALSAALGLPRAVPVLPPFAQVLGANSRGLALLRRIKQNTLVPVSTSLAKLENACEEAKRVGTLEADCENLHAMWLKRPQPGGGAYTRPAAMLVQGEHHDK